MTTAAPEMPTTTPGTIPVDALDRFFDRISNLVDATQELRGHAMAHRPGKPIPPSARGMCSQIALDSAQIADSISEWAYDAHPQDRHLESAHQTLNVLAMAMLYSAGANQHSPLGFMEAAFASDQLLTNMLETTGDALRGAKRRAGARMDSGGIA